MLAKPSQFETAEKKKVFIVDDHPLIREGITQLLNCESDLTVSGEASDMPEALQKIKELVPDLAIIDINLKGCSGLELTSTLHALYPNLPILILSMHDESLYIDRVLKAGAKGFLMKDEAPNHVITAIRQILNGEIYVSESLKENFVQRFVSGGKVINRISPESLSTRELEVLQLVGQGLSTRQISKALHISIKTVDSHYANIKLKLSLKNSNELIQYAVKWTMVA